MYLRRGKLRLARQAVKRALAVSGAGHPQVHCLVIRFCHAATAQQVTSPLPFRHAPCRVLVGAGSLLAIPSRGDAWSIEELLVHTNAKGNVAVPKGHLDKDLVQALQH